MLAIVLTHIDREGPGRLAALAARRGLAVDIRRVAQGDPVPTSLASDELLVVMGGPMGVADLGACIGLLQMVRQAVAQAARPLPVTLTVVGLQGEILSAETVVVARP